MPRRLSSFQLLMTAILGFVASYVLRLLMMTVRVRLEGFEKADACHKKGERVIYALWHGRMLIPAYTHRNKNITIMVSRHRDGEYIAQVIRHLGFKAVRGSTSRGGVKAMSKMLKLSEENIDLAITPDGPRGPKYKVQPGVIFLAQKTGRVIMPAGVSPEKYWQMPSWDEFRVPKPFSKACILIGNPMRVPEKITEEEAERFRIALEKEMQRVTEISDNYFARARRRNPHAPC